MENRYAPLITQLIERMVNLHSEELTRSETLILLAIAEEQGLSSDRQKEGVAPGYIAKRTGLKPYQVSRGIHTLQNEHGESLIEQTINPLDRRSYPLSITNAGTDFVRKFVDSTNIGDYVAASALKEVRHFDQGDGI